MAERGDSKVRTFVRYYYQPGYVAYLQARGYDHTTLDEEVRARDVSQLQVPRNVGMFRFYDVEEVQVPVDGHTETRVSEPCNWSSPHFFCAYEVTVECGLGIMRRFGGDESRLCGHERAVITRYMECFPFTDGDVIVSAADTHGGRRFLEALAPRS